MAYQASRAGVPGDRSDLEGQSDLGPIGPVGPVDPVTDLRISNATLCRCEERSDGAIFQGSPPRALGPRGDTRVPLLG